MVCGNNDRLSRQLELYMTRPKDSKLLEEETDDKEDWRRRMRDAERKRKETERHED